MGTESKEKTLAVLRWPITIYLKIMPTWEQVPQSTSPYSETDGIFSPHSWNFFGGRGYQIEVNSDNMLGTMSATAIAGITSEENQPFL